MCAIVRCISTSNKMCCINLRFTYLHWVGGRKFVESVCMMKCNLAINDDDDDDDDDMVLVVRAILRRRPSRGAEMTVSMLC